MPTKAAGTSIPRMSGSKNNKFAAARVLRTPAL
jgi:hypothetical protein